MSESFDVYVAHDAGDAAAAEALCAALDARGCEVAAGVLLAPGDFVDGLADAQRHSRLTAALVGGGAGDHYTLDAVARAVEQVGEGRYTVVPVILPAAQGRTLPYGLKRVVPLVVGPGGMEDVAEVLAARLRVRPPGDEAPAGGGGRRWRVVGALGALGAVIVAGAVGLWLWMGDGAGDARRAGDGRRSDAGRGVDAAVDVGRDAAVDVGRGDVGQGGVERGDAAMVTPDAEVRRPVARPTARVPDGSPVAVDARVPAPRPSGVGRCEGDRSCALRGPGAARLRRDDVVCLTDRRAGGPTCVVDAAGPVVKCDRLDRFQRESLGEVSWVLCPE